ncbi:hypothetical protein BMS3Abin06_01123 [bacterium BMS3Abin06]|nr:hypothetical protein BMS3Abin06_01123 [bacterium BMS3Abin06]
MNPLEQKIIEKIKKEGPITFETFMDMALYKFNTLRSLPQFLNVFLVFKREQTDGDR